MKIIRKTVKYEAEREKITKVYHKYSIPQCHTSSSLVRLQITRENEKIRKTLKCWIVVEINY